VNIVVNAALREPETVTAFTRNGVVTAQPRLGRGR
jgi:hypothetical protein